MVRCEQYITALPNSNLKFPGPVDVYSTKASFENEYSGVMSVCLGLPSLNNHTNWILCNTPKTRKL